MPPCYAVLFPGQTGLATRRRAVLWPRLAKGAGTAFGPDRRYAGTQLHDPDASPQPGKMLPMPRYTDPRAPLRLTAGSLRHRPLVGYGLAIVAVGVALAIRLAVGDSFPAGFPFLTFFPAIILISYLAGVGPGVVAALLSLAAAWYFLIPPIHSFALAKGTVMPLLFFLAVAGVDIALIAIMQGALDRLTAERRLTASLYDQQRNLFAELQHRVANNMAFISGLLRLQKRRIAADPASAPRAFDEAVNRIDTMGRVHRRLYDPAAANQALGAHLQSICEEIVDGSGQCHIECHVDLPDVRVDLERLLPLSLVVAETVTNSLKHGFPGRDRGRVTVRHEALADGGLAIIIRDDGIGLPPANDSDAAPGLGMRIVDGLVRQFGGTITMSSDGGAVTRVTLPPLAPVEGDSGGGAITRVA